jgi:hypothetical protein
LVTLACVLVIGYASLREVWIRVRKTSSPVEADDHALVVTGLGVTMADGGTKESNNGMLVVTENGIETVEKKKDSTKK